MPDYRRRLPHWHPNNAYIFVTWRLWGTLPFGARSDGRAFALEDRRLDRERSGPHWLGEPRIAEMVAQTILAGERERDFYELRAWVVMPNHVHLLILPARRMSSITRWLKGSTARRANLMLGRTGAPFWQDESYDHWVRTPRELEKVVGYIERNPVSAGLADALEDWPWSSARLAGETACPPTRLAGETACPTRLAGETACPTFN